MKPDLNSKSLSFYIFAGVILVFFLIFLIYPVLYILKEAFFPSGRFSLDLFGLLWTNPTTRESMANSLKLGVTVTLLTSLVSLPLALIFSKYQFPGKTWFSSLLLLPLIIPPFVGAIGIKQFLSRFGSLNLILMDRGWITDPIDFLGSAGFWGVVFLEALHLYPIMYLNLTASLARFDPVYDEAARSLGASYWRRFRTVILPLVLPGYFAGAILVFLWAMTDLGTPLIFDYSRVVPMMIFNMVTDIHSNPLGYGLVVFILLFTITCFVLSRRWAGGKTYETTIKGFTDNREIDLWENRSLIRMVGLGSIYLYIFAVLAISALPHITVLIQSLSGEWFMTILPSRWTFQHYRAVLTHPLAFSSIKTSLILSVSSTIMDIFVGVGIAYMVARKKIRGAVVLDLMTMLTLTIPGLVLAFGYIACFSGTLLDPRINPCLY